MMQEEEQEQENVNALDAPMLGGCRMEQQNFAEEQDTIRAKVIALCREHPEAKRDYRILLQYYWYYVDELKKYVPIDVLSKITQPESICRAFRKGVEEGTIDLEDNEKVVRQVKQRQFREYYSHKEGRWIKEYY